MFGKKCLPIFALLLHSIASDAFKCGPDLGPYCTCYTPTSVTAETSQLVCTDTTDGHKLTAQILLEIGAKIEGELGLLHIYNTDIIKEISKDTFKLATFKRIFIENNKALVDIKKDAFTTSTRTETLAIRQNNKLKKTGLFEIALLLGESLSDVEFHENSIENFENAFNDVKFKNLAYIRLDGQKFESETEIKLVKQSFAKLPKLRQLSLNNGKLSYAKNNNLGVIDLTGVTPSVRISIFLQNSQLVNVDGLLANLNNNVVGLDLESNKLESIPPVCADIATSLGTCFLAGNTESLTKNCKCKDVQSIKTILKNDALKGYIWGLTDVTCESKKITADECTDT